MNSEILQKLARYCAYQERCVQELEQKMKTFEVLPSEFAVYLAWLSENNYLNEARFVEIFVRSKSGKYDIRRIQFKLLQQRTIANKY